MCEAKGNKDHATSCHTSGWACHTTLFPPRPGGPASNSPGVRKPHRHGDLGELFSDAVLHDAPQIEAVVWLVWYSSPLFLLCLFQLMLVLRTKTKSFNLPQRTKPFPFPMLNYIYIKKIIITSVFSVPLSALQAHPWESPPKSLTPGNSLTRVTCSSRLISLLAPLMLLPVRLQGQET